MVMINLKEKVLTISQLKAIVSLAEHQESEDKYINMSILIAGDYYDVTADIDSDGDITIMQG